MKYAAAFIGLALSCAICAALPIPELLGLVIVFLVFFAILGIWETWEPVLDGWIAQQEKDRKFEEQFPGPASRILDPAGVVIQKRQPVRILDIDAHPSDHGEVQSVSEAGVIVRFPDSSLETFQVRLHRDDDHLHVEGLEVDPVAAVL